MIWFTADIKGFINALCDGLPSSRKYGCNRNEKFLWPLRPLVMGLFPDTLNRGLRMRRECRERFPRHRFQRKPVGSGPGMHHGTCVTHVPWCMSGSLNRGGGGKRSPHSRRMRNSQFYISGKRPIEKLWSVLLDRPESSCRKWFSQTNWSMCCKNNDHWRTDNISYLQSSLHLSCRCGVSFNSIMAMWKTRHCLYLR